MSSMSATAHAVQRLSQRNFSGSDLDLALYLGREVEGGCLVLDKDAKLFACWLEELARRVRRLGGMRVVLGGEAFVTVYRSRPKKQKCLIRCAERRNLER